MYILLVNHLKKKIKIFVLAAALWLFMFLFGSYLIEDRLEMSIAIGSAVEFTYPYGIVIDKIFSKNTCDDQCIFLSCISSGPQTVQFTDYSSLEGNFSFKYPSAFLIQKAAFTGGDILYHIDFHERNDLSHGFLQVWNLPGSLEEFLKKSKELSVQKYKYFKSDEIEINGIRGNLWDYAVLTGNGYYKGMEVFLQKDGRMYRLSYFLPEEKWDKKQSEIFWKMAYSLEIKN